MKEPRDESKGLWIAVLGIGMVMGMLIGWGIRGDTPDPVPAVVAAPDAQGTMAVNVNVTLLEATATRTLIPTVAPTPRSKRAPINACGTATPGATCQMPPEPTATATPYPDCTKAKAGEWCVWAKESST
jgi:hypothetical protein